MKLHAKGILIIMAMAILIGGASLLPGSMGEANAMSTPPPSYEITGSITPVENLSSVFFIGSYLTYSGDTEYFFKPLNDAPFLAGQTTAFSFTEEYFGLAPSSYTIFALHKINPEVSGGAAVGSNAIQMGSSWDSLFETEYTQDTFASLLTGSYIDGYLIKFYEDNLGTLGASMGSDLRLVNFSVATDGGSAHASAVPIPATLFLFAPGLAGLAALRRKGR
jgi:hypothetical protein